jgi:hypothetical protein
MVAEMPWPENRQRQDPWSIGIPARQWPANFANQSDLSLPPAALYTLPLNQSCPLLSAVMIKIFIGFDPCESAAFHVLSHSIQARASEPVSICPLMLTQLKGKMTRPQNPMQSTEFAFSRFLVPSLCDFDGWAIFMDCDMLVVDDIANLWALRDDAYAVMCVQHDHVPQETSKFLDRPQTIYERKNWSSVMLFNTAKCRALTPDYVNSASGLQLHRFQWLEDDAEIGEIPHRWNHLVDYDPVLPIAEISNLHWTVGGPYFEKYKDSSYADLWFAERDATFHVDRFK